MSLAARLGLPEAVQTTLLIAAFVLTLTPYFAGLTVGGLQIPAILPRQQRRMRFAGPAMLVAGVALVLPVSFLQPGATDLSLMAVDVTAAGNIDVVVANAGPSPALLTAVEIELVADRGIIVRHELLPGAALRLPIDALSVGGKRKLMIRELIPSRSVERIVIAPETSRGLLLRVRIHAANGVVLTADVDLAPGGSAR
jgi:hypothetical protein